LPSTLPARPLSTTARAFPPACQTWPLFKFDLAFNCTVPTADPTGCQSGPSVLKAISASEGSFLTNGGTNITFFQPGTIIGTGGEIALISDVAVSGASGSGDLLNVTFQAVTPGITSIAILANSDLQLYDSNFTAIVVDNSVTTSPTTQTFPLTSSSLLPSPPHLNLRLSYCWGRESWHSSLSGLSQVN
jgi:hypothetical protein